MDERIIVLVSTIFGGDYRGMKIYYMNEYPDEAKENPELFFNEMYKDILDGRSSAKKYVKIIKVSDINSSFTKPPSVFLKSQIEKDVKDYLRRIESRKENARLREIEMLKELAKKYPEVLKVCTE